MQGVRFGGFVSPWQLPVVILAVGSPRLLPEKSRPNESNRRYSVGALAKIELSELHTSPATELSYSLADAHRSTTKHLGS